MYAIKFNGELWRGSDGFSLRFDTEKEATEYARIHVSEVPEEYEIVEY